MNGPMDAPMDALSALDDSAFRVYTGTGAPASLDDVVAALDTVDVVLMGEEHGDPVTHALQDSLFRWALQDVASDSAEARPVVLSLEMFERDVQPILDEYLAGWITEKHFRRAARAWSNYDDYRPMVEAAKNQGASVLAANAPRRYVNRVSRLGADALQDLPLSARQWLPPLPYPMPSAAYQAKWIDLMRAHMPADHGSDASADASSHGSPHGLPQDNGPSPMLQAQSLWDASMGYTMAHHLMDVPEALIVHVTGAFHMSKGTGTPEALRYYRPGTRMLTVVFRPVDDISTFDRETHAGQADVVVLTTAETGD